MLTAAVEEEWAATVEEATSTTTSVAAEVAVLEVTEGVARAVTAVAAAAEQSATEAMRMGRPALEAREVSPAVAMEVTAATKEMMGVPLSVRAVAAVVVGSP